MYLNPFTLCQDLNLKWKTEFRILGFVIDNKLQKLDPKLFLVKKEGKYNGVYGEFMNIIIKGDTYFEQLLEENEALCIENDKLKQRRQKSIVVKEKESNKF